MHETLVQESLRCSDLTVTLQMYETRRKEEIRCVYCGSTTVDFQDYVQIEKRLNDKKLSVKESWVCIRCGKEFEHLGTRSFPSELAIGHAINFHNAIGGKRKQERLHYLKRYWADKALALSPKVKMNVSLEPEQSCALANFKIEGIEAADIQRKLWKDHSIYTITIKHEEIKGIRVTPHVYTRLDELDMLVQGIKEML